MNEPDPALEAWACGQGMYVPREIAVFWTPAEYDAWCQAWPMGVIVVKTRDVAARNHGRGDPEGEHMTTTDPGAPLPEPALERIATALESIQHELGLLRVEAAKARTPVPQLGPPRRTPPGSPPVLPRRP